MNVSNDKGGSQNGRRQRDVTFALWLLNPDIDLWLGDSHDVEVRIQEFWNLGRGADADTDDPAPDLPMGFNPITLQVAA
jgi:hypothetical protein